MNDFLSRENLEARISTKLFFLLSVATLYFYYFHWMLQLSRKLNTQKQSSGYTRLLILFIAISFWIAQFRTMLEAYNTEETQITYLFVDNYITFATLLTVLCLAIISISMKNTLQDFFFQSDKPVTLSSGLTFFFHGFYLYYCIYNQDKRYAKKLAKQPKLALPSKEDANPAPTKSLLVELKKLQVLLDNGSITKEEFQTIKTSLLKRAVV